MSGYSTINSMGLNDVDSISHHVLSTTDTQDILKIYFKVPDDSTLPDSCCFYFERPEPGSAELQDPKLLAAIAELTSLSEQQSKVDHRERLLDDLERLETVMKSKLTELRKDIGRLV